MLNTRIQKLKSDTRRRGRHTLCCILHIQFSLISSFAVVVFRGSGTGCPAYKSCIAQNPLQLVSLEQRSDQSDERKHCFPRDYTLNSPSVKNMDKIPEWRVATLGPVRPSEKTKGIWVPTHRFPVCGKKKNRFK